MGAYTITKPGASKGIKGGKHSFYEVGEVVNFDTLPASLKGKAKPVAVENVSSDPVSVSVIDNTDGAVEFTVNGSIVTIELAKTDSGETGGEAGDKSISEKYEDLTGKKPDGRWSDERIAEEIEKLNQGE